MWFYVVDSLSLSRSWVRFTHRTTISTKCRCRSHTVARNVWTMERSLPHLQLYWVFSLRLYEVQHEDRDYRRVETLCLHHLEKPIAAFSEGCRSSKWHDTLVLSCETLEGDNGLCYPAWIRVQGLKQRSQRARLEPKWSVALSIEMTIAH